MVVEEALGELALAAITDRLRGMTGVRFFGAAYPNELTVEREFSADAQVRKFPHLIVLPAKGGALTRTSLGLTFSTEHEFTILGYAERAQELPPSTWCARLIEDVARTLLADPALGDVGKVIQIGDWEVLDLSAAAGVTRVGGFELKVTARLGRTFS